MTTTPATALCQIPSQAGLGMKPYREAGLRGAVTGDVHVRVAPG